MACISLALVLSGLPALALGTSEVTGKVLDGAGTPIVGAEVVFTNSTNPSAVYKATTSKKGVYYIPNLLYNEPGKWRVAVHAQGYVATKLKVDSRLADRTLVAGFESNLSPDAAPKEVVIRAFGKAVIDFTLVPVGQADAVAILEPSPTGNRGQVAGEGDPLARALMLVRKGDLEGSLVFFRQTVDAAPEDPEVREHLARVLLELTKLDEAEAQARKAEELGPSRVAPKLLMADVNYRRADYDKAWSYLDQARKMAPEDLGMLQRVAVLSVETHKPAEAIAANEAIVRLKPDNVEAWLSLGDLYHEQGQPAKAEHAYQQVSQLDPANAYKTFFNLGALLENKPNMSDADNKKAIGAFRKAVTIKPDYAIAHRHLAYALLRDNDMEGATAELEKYLELQPKAPDAGEIREIVKSLSAVRSSKQK